MKTRLLTAVLAAALLPASAHAALFQSATVAGFTSALLGAESDSDSASITVNSLPGAPLSTGPLSATATLRTSTATTNLEVNAIWASATQGSVTVDWGWNVAIEGQIPDALVQTNDTSVVPTARNWTYVFTAVADGQFTGSILLTNSGGNTFGLQTLYTDDDLLPFGITPVNISAVAGTFPFSVALAAGQTYTMSIFNYGNVRPGPDYTADIWARAEMNWEIVYGQQVSEPATLALLGAGLMGLAAIRRRKA